MNQFDRTIRSRTGHSFNELSSAERYQITHVLYQEALKKQIIIQKGSNHKWLRCPIPTMYEPEKMIRMFTDLGDYDEDHMINLYRKASLHGVDGFFKIARDKVKMFSRDTVSANTGNRWYGYSPYRADMIPKLAAIFRFYYNYMKRRGDVHEVPAVKLGLAKAPIKVESIFY